MVPGAEKEMSALPSVGSWAAIHTHPRCEKVVAEFARSRGVSVFLPLRTNRRVYGARVRFSQLPLFPGYLFYDRAAIDRNTLFDSRRVARILVPDDPQELAADLKHVARALAAKQEPMGCDIGPPGTLVEVIAGPLYGAVGELVRREGGWRLVLRVRFLGFAAEVTIDEASVQPVGALL